jgi:hypothetical protein
VKNINNFPKTNLWSALICYQLWKNALMDQKLNLIAPKLNLILKKFDLLTKKSNLSEEKSYLLIKKSDQSIQNFPCNGLTKKAINDIRFFQKKYFISKCHYPMRPLL